MMETNKRVLKVAEAIAKKVEEGYELLEKGMGDYTSIEASYKSKGYVTYGWYTFMTKEVSQRQYVIYGRSKKSKSSQVEGQMTLPIASTEDNLVAIPVNPESAIESVYQDMSVKALREICKHRQVKGYSKMNKAQMIESLYQAC